MLASMPNVGKVTLSLPVELLARVEAYRETRGVSRSEAFSDLAWRGWHQVEEQDREARYRSAYERQPETADELTWAEVAAADLLSPEAASWDEGARAAG